MAAAGRMNGCATLRCGGDVYPERWARVRSCGPVDITSGHAVFELRAGPAFGAVRGRVGQCWCGVWFRKGDLVKRW